MPFYVVLTFFLFVIVNSAERNTVECLEKKRSSLQVDLPENSMIEMEVVNSDCDNGDSEKSIKAGKTSDATPSQLNTKQRGVNLFSKLRDVANMKNENPAVDCLDILRRGQSLSGVYTIRTKGSSAGKKTLKVFCDMETDGGGWTVIQRRNNYTQQEDFSRDWKSYQLGFGNVSRDFWIGNDNIFHLSSLGNSVIRFDLGDLRGERVYALYGNFNVEGAETNYKLHVSNYSGNAGDAWGGDGMMFSTTETATTPCAAFMSGGWWFNRYCGSCNPNGLYQPGKDNVKTAHWFSFKQTVGLSFVEIKLRRSH